MAFVLLAEDDLSLARIFGKWIQAAGHEVALVENGVAGLQSATLGQHPDLLVTDVMMPEADGEELSVAVGMLLPDTPVLIVTATSDQEKLARLKAEPNVREVLAKPVPREVLLTAIEQALAGARD